MANEYAAINDMLDDWTEKILMMARTMHSSDKNPISNIPHQYTNGTLKQQEQNDGHRHDNEPNGNNGINNNHGHKHHLRTQRTSTACNDNEITSARRHHAIPTRNVQPILRWTRQHTASYLAITEVACTWNIEPG